MLIFASEKFNINKYDFDKKRNCNLFKCLFSWMDLGYSFRLIVTVL